MNTNGHAHKRFNYLGIALVTSLVLLTSMAARADDDDPTIIATGAVYGGPTPHQETCYLFNADTTSAVSFSWGQILGEDPFGSSTPFLPTATSCNGALSSTAVPGSGAGIGPFILAAGRICFITVAGATTIPPSPPSLGGNTNQAWACRFKATRGPVDKHYW